MIKLKLYVAQFKGIEKPLYLVAKNFDIALSDAHLFDTHNQVITLAEVSDQVHIDFKRENESISEFIKANHD